MIDNVSLFHCELFSRETWNLIDQLSDSLNYEHQRGPNPKCASNKKWTSLVRTFSSRYRNEEEFVSVNVTVKSFAVLNRRGSVFCFFWNNQSPLGISSYIRSNWRYQIFHLKKMKKKSLYSETDLITRSCRNTDLHIHE